MDSMLMAPCGMNCRLCMAYGRRINPCGGCNSDAPKAGKSCGSCVVKLCAKRVGTYCSPECGDYPCAKLIRMDERYRTKYGMSVLDNLAKIREIGIDDFAAHEEIHWTCPSCGAILCVHRRECPGCGAGRIDS